MASGHASNPSNRNQRPTVPSPPPWHADLTTVGVTGTNGKTTTTAYVAAALSRLSSPVPRITTVGFFVGDERLDLKPGYPAFLHTLALGRQRGARHAAIELSSEALALGFFHAWPCRIGVFTNLTQDHLDRHGSPEHYLASKAQLFLHLPAGGAAILNGCDPASELLAEVIPRGVRLLHYGARSRGAPVAPLDVEATDVQVSWAGTRIALRASLELGQAPAVLELRSIGDVFAENGLAALTAAIAAGVPAQAAVEAISAAPPPPGRFELVRTDPHVVIDYAHTPDALERTLGAARKLTPGNLTVVFGAGGERDQDKRPMMGKAARFADRVVITSDNPRSEDPALIAAAIREGLGDHPHVETVLDRADAIRHAVRTATRGDTVVIAGKGHESEQHVDGTVRHFSDREIATEA
jgi:UDP-N-acetylmuramoyl-L-alanyl-D-glutamate--2,6-diaminopimelate ligase